MPPIIDDIEAPPDHEPIIENCLNHDIRDYVQTRCFKCKEPYVVSFDKILCQLADPKMFGCQILADTPGKLCKRCWHTHRMKNHKNDQCSLVQAENLRLNLHVGLFHETQEKTVCLRGQSTATPFTDFSETICDVTGQIELCLRSTVWNRDGD